MTHAELSTFWKMGGAKYKGKRVHFHEDNALVHTLSISIEKNRGIEVLFPHLYSPDFAFFDIFLYLLTHNWHVRRTFTLNDEIITETNAFRETYFLYDLKKLEIHGIKLKVYDEI